MVFPYNGPVTAVTDDSSDSDSCSGNSTRSAAPPADLTESLNTATDVGARWKLHGYRSTRNNNPYRAILSRSIYHIR